MEIFLWFLSGVFSTSIFLLIGKFFIKNEYIEPVSASGLMQFCLVNILAGYVSLLALVIALMLIILNAVFEYSSHSNIKFFVFLQKWVNGSKSYKNTEDSDEADEGIH